MKTVTLSLSVAVFVLSAGFARADSRQGTGVGVMIGEPTGLSLKHWSSRTEAFAAGLAWSFSENDSFHLHVDKLWHGEVPFQRDRRMDFQQNPVFYYGVGARLKLQERSGGRGRNRSNSLLGIRVPLGLSFDLPEAPVDIFVEIVPVLDVVPRTDFALNAAVGIRYFF